MTMYTLTDCLVSGWIVPTIPPVANGGRTRQPCALFAGGYADGGFLGAVRGR